MRVGIGWDAHPLVTGRKLVLGGIEIPFDRGPEGWSDADVLTHAVIDALLGAAALGDIGSHFPAGRLEYQDISSLTLLGQVKDMLTKDDWQVVNIDATVVAEQPRLASFIPEIRKRLSQTMDIKIGQVSIKASTANGLGFVGRGEGITAHAVALIEGSNNEDI